LCPCPRRSTFTSRVKPPSPCLTAPGASNEKLGCAFKTLLCNSPCAGQFQAGPGMVKLVRQIRGCTSAHRCGPAMARAAREFFCCFFSGFVPLQFAFSTHHVGSPDTGCRSGHTPSISLIIGALNMKIVLLDGIRYGSWEQIRNLVWQFRIYRLMKTATLSLYKALFSPGPGQQ